MEKGLFITVEGGDGSGKTTQLAFIKEYLTEKGEDVLFTREPGGTALGEKIRSVILDPANKEMVPMTESLLYAATINGYAIGDCSPDATILIKVDPAKSHARIDEAAMDRMEQESAAFHRRVYEGYLALEQKYPDRIVGIDGEQPIEEVSRQIARQLDRLLMKKHGL